MNKNDCLHLDEVCWKYFLSSRGTLLGWCGKCGEWVEEPAEEIIGKK